MRFQTDHDSVVVLPQLASAVCTPACCRPFFEILKPMHTHSHQCNASCPIPNPLKPFRVVEYSSFPLPHNRSLTHACAGGHQ